MRVYGDLRLATSVTDLHPYVPTAARASLSHGAQSGKSGGVRRTINDHIAGPFEMVAIDLNIAGNQQATAAIRPKAIEPLKFRGGSTVRVRQPFGHGTLCQSIRQNRAAG
jgi:hypothetical protein